jgi:hypothetical protein
LQLYTIVADDFFASGSKDTGSVKN